MASEKSFTRFIPVVVRILLGLLFTMTGLNGFLNFIPPPKEPMPEQAMAMAGALMGTKYMLYLIAGNQLVCGVLLVVGRFVPLALAMLAPMVVNILLFHVFLAPQGTGMAIGVVAAELYLAWAYRGAFRPMLAMNAKPGAAA